MNWPSSPRVTNLSNLKSTKPPVPARPQPNRISSRVSRTNCRQRLPRVVKTTPKRLWSCFVKQNAIGKRIFGTGARVGAHSTHVDLCNDGHDNWCECVHASGRVGGRCDKNRNNRHTTVLRCAPTPAIYSYSMPSAYVRQALSYNRPLRRRRARCQHQ